MQELQRTPLAEEVGILAAGDLALRFVEWFGFEELARTGTRVNKRWHAATLVFAPPEAEFKVQHKEIFDGFRTLEALSYATVISLTHPLRRAPLCGESGGGPLRPLLSKRLWSIRH